jgi:hypothetical protein
MRKRTEMTPLEKNAELTDLVKDINEILSECKIDEKISLQDIIVADKTVSDFSMPNAKLSDAITNSLWPSVASADVYHYTSRDAAESILNSGSFHLNNIANRYHDGEIKTFCETHGLQGYLAPDEKGYPTYKSLIMPNTFYASFTNSSLSEDQEEYFWRNFAANDGVRLKFSIEALNPNFRKMRYEQTKGEPIPVLYKLTKRIRDKYGREFILRGISRLCSFYLSGDDYEKENEYRLLHRVWEGFGPQPKNASRGSYIELPLDVMNECGYKLNITEVHANEKPNMPSTFHFSKRTR